MAGHSQFKNIMHKKGKQDAIRSKLFSKFAREITVAAKMGMPDPNMNPRLRLAVQAARAENMHTEPDVKRRIDFILARVIEQVYVNRLVAGLVTEDALRARYDAAVKQATPKVEARARHILVTTEAAAKALVVKLKEGADFSELAAAESTGPSKARGGDLGFFGRGDMVPEFADAAFALAPGQFTENPVKTQFGWHVIKLEEKRNAPVPGFEESREKLATQMREEIVRGMVQSARADAKVERFNLDGTPMAPEPAAPERVIKPVR